jgi:hypothetical protein
VEAGQFACFDAIPEDLAKIILQDFELHGRSIAPPNRMMLSGGKASSQFSVLSSQ